jgi:hypothetical protein
MPEFSVSDFLVSELHRRGVIALNQKATEIALSGVSVAEMAPKML